MVSLTDNIQAVLKTPEGDLLEERLAPLLNPFHKNRIDFGRRAACAVKLTFRARTLDLGDVRGIVARLTGFDGVDVSMDAQLVITFRLADLLQQLVPRAEQANKRLCLGDVNAWDDRDTWLVYHPMVAKMVKFNHVVIREVPDALPTILPREDGTFPSLGSDAIISHKFHMGAQGPRAEGRLSPHCAKKLAYVLPYYGGEVTTQMHYGKLTYYFSVDLPLNPVEFHPLKAVVDSCAEEYRNQRNAMVDKLSAAFKMAVSQGCCYTFQAGAERMYEHVVRELAEQYRQCFNNKYGNVTVDVPSDLFSPNE